MNLDNPTAAISHNAEIVREYGPFPGASHIAGVSFDGQRVWAATGTALLAFDPASGETERRLECVADAGTAFDGTHLYQIAESRIDKIDLVTGQVLGSIPAPGQGRDSGLAWAEGSLWVGQHRDRKIRQIDPATGAILRTIESNRFVTGVTWVDGELWHGTWENDASDIRRIAALGYRVRSGSAVRDRGPVDENNRATVTHYIRLTADEQAFKQIKYDRAIRPIFEETAKRIARALFRGRPLPQPTDHTKAPLRPWAVGTTTREISAVRRTPRNLSAAATALAATEPALVAACRGRQRRRGLRGQGPRAPLPSANCGAQAVRSPRHGYPSRVNPSAATASAFENAHAGPFPCWAARKTRFIKTVAGDAYAKGVAHQPGKVHRLSAM